MANDEGTKPKASFDVSVGKEIDAALGDVLRGLLKKPAKEAGDLLADSIGILGDRVRRKRQMNAQLGLEETRAQLEAKGVELTDITPPEEEDLHIVVEGMSLAGDDKLRDLWSGLLATALDPDSESSVERPFTSAIASLSPADARIMTYAAFVTKNNREIQSDARKAAGVAEKPWLTFGESDRIEKARLAMDERLGEFWEAVTKMESDFDLQKIAGRKDWAENLTRLGIIQAKSNEYRPSSGSPSIDGRSGDIRDLLSIFKFFERRVQETETLALEGLKIRYLAKSESQKRRITLGLEFTGFGEKLCTACGLL